MVIRDVPDDGQLLVPAVVFLVNIQSRFRHCGFPARNTTSFLLRQLG